MPLSHGLPALLAVSVVLLGLGVNRASKGAVLGALALGQPIEVVGTPLRFSLTFDPGAAFSLGASTTLALSIFAIVALLTCVFTALRRMRTLPQGPVVGLPVTGASRNPHDRLLRVPGLLLGHVVDFVQLPHFVIFSMADVYITSTAVLVVPLDLRNPSSDGKGSRWT